MEIFKVVSFVLIALSLVIVLKSSKKDDFALLVIIISSVVILGYLILQLEDIVNILNELVLKSGIDSEYLKLLLKVTGIVYVVELASNICKDAGSSALASKMEMVGKISIVVITIPIFSSVISVVLDIL